MYLSSISFWYHVIVASRSLAVRLEEEREWGGENRSYRRRRRKKEKTEVTEEEERSENDEEEEKAPGVKGRRRRGRRGRSIRHKSSRQKPRPRRHNSSPSAIKTSAYIFYLLTWCFAPAWSMHHREVGVPSRCLLLCMYSENKLHPRWWMCVRQGKRICFWHCSHIVQAHFSSRMYCRKVAILLRLES